MYYWYYWGYLVFNVVCMSVCLYVMDRHNNLLLGLMILYQLLRELLRMGTTRL